MSFFNPEEYLKRKRAQTATTNEVPPAPTTTPTGGFDPEAYLAKKRAASIPMEAETQGISRTESALRGAAQGATFGFADEIVGAGEGLVNTLSSQGGSLSENYAKARDESRANSKAAEDANPLTYLAGSLAGSTATAFVPGAGAANIGKAAAGIIKGGGTLAKISRGVVGAGATGTVLGMAQGAGSSEGKTVGDITGDVVKGGVVGAAFGGALGGAGKLLPGVKDSVSNDLYRKVLGVTVGDDAAEVATKYLKDPEARNRIAAAANKDTVKEAKDAIANVVATDVASFQTQAAKAGRQLLSGVTKQLEDKRVELVQGVSQTVYKLAGKPRAKAVSATLREVQDILEGKALDVAESAGISSGAPAADAIREARIALKQALFQGGNPKKGVKDTLSLTDAAVLGGVYKKLQGAYKAIPEAATADKMYSKASSYVDFAKAKFFRPDGGGGKEISNAAVESFALGKGTPGKVEDLDRLWQRRDEFAKVMKDAGLDVSENSSKAAMEAAREVMDFNRLGVGDTTGRSAIPAIVGTGFTTALGGPAGALSTALAAAAYNPRMYLRALAKADNLTSDDRKIMAALVKALRLEGIKNTDKRVKGDEDK